MANELNIHRTTLTDYEKNIGFIDADILRKISIILGLQEYELFDDYHIFLDSCEEKIREYRTMNGMSLSKIAKHCNVSKSTIWQWEKKMCNPTVKNWIALKELLKL